MYIRFAESNRGQIEIMSESTSELGDYKEVIIRIAGLGAYSKLKFESGGHRFDGYPPPKSKGTYTLRFVPSQSCLELMR
jgi:peptide chain release factor 1